MGRFLAWAGVTVIGLVLAGMLAMALLKTLIGALFYLVVGALVVGGAVALYGRARRALAPGSRARFRLEAAARTARDRGRYR